MERPHPVAPADGFGTEADFPIHTAAYQAQTRRGRLDGHNGGWPSPDCCGITSSHEAVFPRGLWRLCRLRGSSQRSISSRDAQIRKRHSDRRDRPGGIEASSSLLSMRRRVIRPCSIGCVGAWSAIREPRRSTSAVPLPLVASSCSLLGGSVPSSWLRGSEAQGIPHYRSNAPCADGRECSSECWCWCAYGRAVGASAGPVSFEFWGDRISRSFGT